MRRSALLALILATAGCVMSPARAPVAPPPLPPTASSLTPLSPEQAAINFVSVVEHVEPVAESVCRARAPLSNCDFQIAIDDRRGMPPNAFQTVDEAGRPFLVFSLSLIADARNPDEIAFVLGHEASHHIAGHIELQDRSAQTGAVLAGAIASAGGAGPEEIRAAQEFGATLGARTYSKDFELEADALGAEIAWRAGYDPVIGMGFFDRLPDPGDEFLGTHPPNAQRKAVVLQVVRQLSGGAP